MKTTDIRLRVSPEFKAIIQEKAKENGISISNIIRRGVELFDVDAEEEIAKRDAKIRKLEKAKMLLKKKLRDAGDEMPPHISECLEDSIKKIAVINSSLKEILQYKDQCDPKRIARFCYLVRRTVQIILDNKFEGEEKWKLLSQEE